MNGLPGPIGPPGPRGRNGDMGPHVSTMTFQANYLCIQALPVSAVCKPTVWSNRVLLDLLDFLEPLEVPAVAVDGWSLLVVSRDTMTTALMTPTWCAIATWRSTLPWRPWPRGLRRSAAPMVPRRRQSACAAIWRWPTLRWRAVSADQSPDGCF